MTFNSLQYVGFFVVVWLLYWRLDRTRQNVLLLLASYLFYGLFDWRFLGLLLLSTAVDYQLGHRVGQEQDQRRRKWWLWASVALNLGILAIFKYLDFFFDSAKDALGAIGLDVSPPLLRIVLPVGISFYTFHGISYVFDVYRGHIKPTRRLLDYACFVAYFPQLVAGPIGRATLQLPQFEHDRERPDGATVERALLLILVGLFKKVVIADGVASVANTAFASPATTGWELLVVGGVAFALQIYGDFSGYSDIARGSSRLLGIELPVNFTEPYLSRNITEFWRRWHISLSNWLRDYLYVPLGGNRGSSAATYRNLMIVMLLGGLWHGAAKNFVVWGAGHGLALGLHRAWVERRRRRGASALTGPVPDTVARIGTFGVVCLLWIFFRSPTLTGALEYVEGILRFRDGPIDSSSVATVLAGVLAVLAIDLVTRWLRGTPTPVLSRVGAVPAGAGIGVALLAIAVFSGGAPTPFIYFQF